MKLLKKMALTAMIVSVPFVALGRMSTDGEHLFCNFETESDFSQWTTEDANGKSDNDQNYWDYDSSRGAAYVKHGSMECDDWLFTPKMSLTAGKEYVVKLMFQASWDCRLSLSYGTESNIASQTEITEMTLYPNGWHYAAIKMPAGFTSGEYSIGIHCGTKPTDGGWLFLHSVEVVEDHDGSLSLTLKDSNTTESLQNANISLAGEYYKAFSLNTDEHGSATFSNLTPGTYTVSYSLDGYEPEEVSVTVGEKETVSKELTATPLAQVTVSGKVMDYAGRTLEGVAVSLSGVKQYSGTTDADGVFSISEVRGNEEYSLVLKKDMYQKYEESLSTGKSDIDLGTITLENYFDQPRGIAADATEAGMFVSWLAPVGEQEFYYDRGFEGCHILRGSFVTYVRYGVMFAEPMAVKELKWLAAYVYDGKVDVAVYLLDQEGNISTTACYEAKDVPCETYNWKDELNWQYYTLPEVIEAPYGCLVSIGHEAMESPIQICFDYSNNGGPSYTSYNDLSDGWSKCYASNFLIRANGVKLTRDVTFGSKKAKGIRALSNDGGTQANLEDVSFDVWRIAGNSLEETSAWTAVASDVHALYTIDTEFNKQGKGVYRYAVQAKHANGKKSEISYSTPIEHKLQTNVRVYVYTNSAVDFSNGAQVTLMSEENASQLWRSTTGTDGIATFDNLPKGVYTVRVEKYGFETAEYDNVDYSSESAYLSQIALSLKPFAPFTLEATQAEESQDVEVSWNKSTGIFEDFEGMEDFSINPAGDLGWSYADVDGDITFGVGECEDSPYPNMFSPMAFMVFNPSATTPDVTQYCQPYSGQKMLISAGLHHGGRNDDYLFSPELSDNGPKTLSFQASSGFYGSLGNEEFMVGYTTEAAEPENVIWLTERAESVTGKWTSFSYTLPAEAKHAVIRCVSNQCMFFMIDDIFIGSEEAEIFAMTTFNVYLDEEFAGTTSSRAFEFKNLEEGKHIVKVQTVYPMADYSNLYSDFTELVFEVKSESAGVEAVSTEQEEAVYYTIDGLRVDNPEAHGVYIKVQGGKATKISK